MRRRWFELRLGHGNYMGMGLALFNTVTLVYLAIKTSSHGISFWLIVPALSGFYLLICVILGHYHTKRQLPTESIIAAESNPYTMIKMAPKEVIIFGALCELCHRMGIDTTNLDRLLDGTIRMEQISGLRRKND